MAYRNFTGFHSRRKLLGVSPFLSGKKTKETIKRMRNHLLLLFGQQESSFGCCEERDSTITHISNVEMKRCITSIKKKNITVPPPFPLLSLSLRVLKGGSKLGGCSSRCIQYIHRSPGFVRQEEKAKGGHTTILLFNERSALSLFGAVVVDRTSHVGLCGVAVGSTSRGQKRSWKRWKKKRDHTWAPLSSIQLTSRTDNRRVGQKGNTEETWEEGNLCSAGGVGKGKKEEATSWMPSHINGFVWYGFKSMDRDN